ncbi:M20 family metallopeptidase [Neorhizobium sp. JUb45]|uniref:M20 family metallopeptidase n=1 Tax=unclassified Neorhizobium TaxID=2629175 RepID=UPI00104AAD13|nr:M20 family metallopeptidase [Neorhizobium sp. JUb45]TCR06475.1 acetylornithine deacetylase/succinyl-diaminopimelate desuccinylase-like protein [Neorhizobium sp. JUb45]
MDAENTVQDQSHVDTRAAVLARAERYFDDGDFLADLTRLVAIRSESQDPAKAPYLMEYLTDAIEPMLREMDFQTQIFDNPLPGGAPLLVGSRIEDPALKTVLIYGHGDVCNPQEGFWREGLSPFDIVVEGDRIYGRGTADNKVQHLINFRALGFLLTERGKLGFNVKVIVEMSEETGSAGLREFFRANKDLLKSDVLIASDGPRLQADTATVFMGSRGAINFELVADFREGAYHSGNFGGLISDPAIVLLHAIASITDARGQIHVPEWRPTSLTPDVRDALSGLPMGSDGPPVEENWGEEGLTPAERAFGWNSFAVLAMTSGVPDCPLNAIAGVARATCQLRFVVGTDADEILPALRRHLDAAGFERVVIRAVNNDIFQATRVSPDHPWVRLVTGSLERTEGRPPHVLPNLAGSLPNDAFSEILGLPTVWVPHSYGGCCQHAPNEHVLGSLSKSALRNMAGIFADIAESGGPS